MARLHNTDGNRSIDAAIPMHGGVEVESEADLKTLVTQLGRDASQLARDELTLARIELRQITREFTSDLKEAGSTLVKDLARVGVALSLGMLALLALTTGAILGLGELLDATWAGALIVGAVLLVAAAIFARNAMRDMRESDALRLRDTRETVQRNKEVIAEEAQETKRFAREEASEFKRHASPRRYREAHQ